MKSRHCTISLAAAVCAVLAAPAAAQTTLKLHHFLPPKAPAHTKMLAPWAADVEKASGGKVKIELFPAMALGGKPPELYRQMVQGIADIVFTLPGYTSGDFPMLSLTELPGAATDAHDGTNKLWERMKQGFFNKELADAKVLMLWNSDNAGLMTRSKEIRSPADVKGLRVRAPSEAQSKQIDFMGGIGVSMPVTQIYQSLERADKRINVIGVAESNTRVSSLMRQLDGSEWFENPNLTSVQAATGFGEQASSFKMTVSISPPAEEKTGEK